MIFVIIRTNRYSYKPNKRRRMTMMRLGQLRAFVVAFMLTIPMFSIDAATAADKEVEVRFSAYYPEHYPVFKNGWQPWEAMVEKESNGAITFKNYLNGVLHAAKHGFRATSTDVCDITTGYPGYQRSSFHLAHVNDLPFFFPRTYIGPLIMEELYSKYFKQEYEKMGVYLACWVNVSGYNLLSKKPVTRLEDMKGMKVRSTGATCSEFLEALGAVPVMIQNAESYTALQSGTVDAVLLASGPIEAMKLHENAKYLTKINIMHMGIPYAMNKKFFDSLSSTQKSFFYKKLRQASQMTSQAYDIEDSLAENRMKATGVQISTLSDKEMSRFREAVFPVLERFVKENEKRGLPVKEMLKDIEELKEKYKDISPEEALELVTQHPIQGIINF